MEDEATTTEATPAEWSDAAINALTESGSQGEFEAFLAGASEADISAGAAEFRSGYAGSVTPSPSTAEAPATPEASTTQVPTETPATTETEAPPAPALDPNVSAILKAMAERDAARDQQMQKWIEALAPKPEPTPSAPPKLDINAAASGLAELGVSNDAVSFLRNAENERAHLESLKGKYEDKTLEPYLQQNARDRAIAQAIAALHSENRSMRERLEETSGQRAYDQHMTKLGEDLGAMLERPGDEVRQRWGDTLSLTEKDGSVGRSIGSAIREHLRGTTTHASSLEDIYKSAESRLDEIELAVSVLKMAAPVDDAKRKELIGKLAGADVHLKAVLWKASDTTPPTATPTAATAPPANGTTPAPSPETPTGSFGAGTAPDLSLASEADLLAHLQGRG